MKKNDFCDIPRYCWESFKTFDRCLRSIYKFSSFFIAIFRFCSILEVMHQQRHMWNETAVGATFVSSVFRRVLGSLLPVVLIHLRHGGEFRFALVQSVVWALLERCDGEVQREDRQRGGWRTGMLLSLLRDGMVQFDGGKKRKTHQQKHFAHNFTTVNYEKEVE